MDYTTEMQYVMCVCVCVCVCAGGWACACVRVGEKVHLLKDTKVHVLKNSHDCLLECRACVLDASRSFSTTCLAALMGI